MTGTYLAMTQPCQLVPPAPRTKVERRPLARGDHRQGVDAWRRGRPQRGASPSAARAALPLLLLGRLQHAHLVVLGAALGLQLRAPPLLLLPPLGLHALVLVGQGLAHRGPGGGGGGGGGRARSCRLISTADDGRNNGPVRGVVGWGARVGVVVKGL